MTPQTISIIVLTFNRRRVLRDCLESLFAQTYPSDRVEIIVSDDGSTDGTREMVEQLQARHARLTYAPQPHRGIPAARNNGIRHATGDIVAIVADDYILDPTYASTTMQFFHDRPDAQIVRGKVVAAGSDIGSRISHFYFDVSVRRRLELLPPTPVHDWRGRLARAWRKPRPFEETITTEHQLEAAGAAAFRREVFLAVGAFDETLQRAEDTDMTMRLRTLGIEVYYNPFQRIRHQYSPWMADTVAKCYLTGVNRSRLYHKHAVLRRPGGAVRTLIAHEAETVLTALWRVRQAESLQKLVCYLPFMFLFEGANGLGFFLGFVSGRWRGRRPV
jgi:glycosyltransferase involved in cell wall biosynthesis